MDFLYLSGLLAKHFNVVVIDAIAEKLTRDDVLNDLTEKRPEIVIFLTSGISLNEDITFIESLKANLHESILIGTGDVFREENEFVDTWRNIIDAGLADFTSGELLQDLLRTDPFDEFKIIGKSENRKEQLSLSVPKWNLFKMKHYNFPFAKHPDYATVLTNIGCPYTCHYCPMGTMSFRQRPMDEVIQELDYLKGIGIKEIFFRDQTFGSDREWTNLFLKEMIKKDYRFSWSCFVRSELVDLDVALLMRDAGCHTVMIGVENASAALLKNHGRDSNIHRLQKNILLLRGAGLRVLGTFIFGLPGDSLDNVELSIKLAKKLKLDFVSLNLAVPRAGTLLRKRSRDQKDIAIGLNDLPSLDWDKPSIQIDQLKRTLRLAYIKFYLSPIQIFRISHRITSRFELTNMLRVGFFMLRFR